MARLRAVRSHAAPSGPSVGLAAAGGRPGTPVVRTCEEPSTGRGRRAPGVPPDVPPNPAGTRLVDSTSPGYFCCRPWGLCPHADHSRGLGGNSRLRLLTRELGRKCAVASTEGPHLVVEQSHLPRASWGLQQALHARSLHFCSWLGSSDWERSR